METGSPENTGTTGDERAGAERAGSEPERAGSGPERAGSEPEQARSEPEQAGSEPVKNEPVETEPAWIGLPPGLLRMRRLLLVVWLGLLAVGLGLLLGLLAGPVWAAFALLPLALTAWGWVMLDRNWRSWRYAERADDLLISRGVLWREETVVPYGRMQLVEVTSGPVERHFGLASVQLHTAAAATDATIPGLDPAEAERLRDRLTELGEARSAGL